MNNHLHVEKYWWMVNSLGFVLSERHINCTWNIKNALVQWHYWGGGNHISGEAGDLSWSRDKTCDSFIFLEKKVPRE